jgi:hypothetical protein
MNNIFSIISRTILSLPIFNDFYSYYIASNLIQTSHRIYGVTDAFSSFVEQHNFHFLWGGGYSYPPLMAILLIPLSRLSFPSAVLIWTFCNLVLYGLFIKQILKKAQKSHKKIVLIFLIFFGPVYGSIINGQVNVIILWLLYLYLYSKDEFVGALSLCIAGWIKVYPFLFLLKDVIQKKRSLILPFVPLFILFFLFQIFPISDHYLQEFFLQTLPQMQTTYDPYITNQSLTGFISRLTDRNYCGLIILVAELLTLGFLTIITVHKNKKNKEVVDLLWLLTLLLISGKNSYWNMAPVFFIFQYFIVQDTLSIDLKSKTILTISAAVTMIFPVLIFFLSQNPIFVTTSFGKILSSLGFISLVSLYYPLLKTLR